MLNRLSQLLLHNFEDKYIRMRLCVSNWIGRKIFENLMKTFMTTVLFSDQTGCYQKFVDAW